MRLSRYWSHDQTDVLMKSVKVSMGFTGVWLAESGCFAVVPCQSTDLNWIMHYLEPMRWLWLKIDFTVLFHPIIRFIFLLSFSFLLSEISSCLWAFLVTLFPPLACTHTHAYPLHRRMLRNFQVPELLPFRGAGRWAYPQEFSFLLCIYFHLSSSCLRQESHKAVFLCSQLLRPQNTLVLQQPAGEGNCLSDPHSVGTVSPPWSQALTPTDMFWWVFFL